MKKNILFVVPTQYGYHTTSYHYCELLVNSYNVFYVGCDYGKKQIHSSHNVNVYAVKFKTKWQYRIDLLRLVLRLQKQHKFDKSFITYFPLCSFFLFFLPRHSTVMDVRTSFVCGKVKTYVLNSLLRFESYIFKHITVISEGVADFLKLPKSRCSILPLGGEHVEYIDRGVMSMSLLYVGTFYDRYIEKTVEGVALFLKKNPDVYIKYTIIGMGTVEEVNRIKNAIKKNALEDIVFFAGEKRYKELLPYYETHDVGVSYIPLTAYYDCQPPTKTYEYILNGMAVIATPTSENKKVIDSSNGITLSGDTTQDFATGLEQLCHSIKTFNSSIIYKNAQQYSWEQIVKTNLMDIIIKK